MLRAEKHDSTIIPPPVFRNITKGLGITPMNYRPDCIRIWPW